MAVTNRARNRRKDLDPIRGAKRRALYGGDYRKRRAEALAGATHCHLCGQPFTATDRIQADHLVAGDPHSGLLAAHSACNESRGNKPLS